MVEGNQDCEVEFIHEKPVSRAECQETLIIKGFDDRFWQRYLTVAVTTKVKLVSSESSSTLDVGESIGTKPPYSINSVKLV